MLAWQAVHIYGQHVLCTDHTSSGADSAGEVPEKEAGQQLPFFGVFGSEDVFLPTLN